MLFRSALLVLRLVFAQLYDINQIYQFNFELYYSTTFTIVLVGIISIIMLFIQFFLTRAIAPRFKTKLAVFAVLLSFVAQAYMIYKIGVIFGLF